MGETNLRRHFRDAIGEVPIPSELGIQIRAALKRELEAPRIRLDWLPAVVAVLLGVAIIASLLAIGAYRRGQTSPLPSHASRPALVYVEGQSAWQAVDWTGHERGSVGSTLVGIPYQSPDGSRLMWSPQGVWQVVDAKGTVLSTPDLSRSRGFTWADDSSGICVLNVINEDSPNGGSYKLDFYSATGGYRIIASLVTDRGPNIAACSPSSGRVVITTASGYKDPATEQRRITFGELDVVDFNTGKLLRQEKFPIGNLATEVNEVSVSRDGLLAAQSVDAQTSIVSLADGHVAAQAAGVTPLGFSWDDKRLVVVESGGRGEILQVSNGTPTWRDSSSRVTQGAIANPQNSEVMLFATSGGLDDLVVVAPDGSSRVIATDVFPAQVSACADCSAF